MQKRQLHNLQPDLKFYLYEGDLIGLPCDFNHFVFRWNVPDVKVLFSAAKQGLGMSCHYANEGASFSQMNEAISDFVNFVFYSFPWCVCIFAKTLSRSVSERISSIGFKHLLSYEKYEIYVLEKGYK